MGTFYLKQMGALARNGSINFGMNQDIQEWTQQNLWKTALNSFLNTLTQILVYSLSFKVRLLTGN